MELLTYIAIALMMGSLSAYFAMRRGRSPAVWFCVGMLFGALGVLALFLFPASRSRVQKVRREPQVSCVAYQSPEESVPSENVSHELWYYLDKAHVQFGPVSIEALRQLLQSGAITSQNFVWKEGMIEWKKIEDLALYHSKK